MKKMSQLMIVILAIGILSGCQNAATIPQDTPGSDEEKMVSPYIGAWESVSAENLGNGTFGTRYFNLTEGEWEVKFTLYLDSTLQMPVFEFRGVGGYEVQGQSQIVDGAENALFKFDNKYVTLLTDNPDVINGFGFGSCNLEQGKAQDITEDGCSFLVSKSVCGQEYDLLKLDNGLLYFGMRPAEGDMCAEERRPTALFYPLKRKG